MASRLWDMLPIRAAAKPMPALCQEVLATEQPES